MADENQEYVVEPTTISQPHEFVNEPPSTTLTTATNMVAAQDMSGLDQSGDDDDKDEPSTHQLGTED